MTDFPDAPREPCESCARLHGEVSRLQEGRERRWALAVEVDTLRAQVARLERERDEARAESARLREALEDLAGCVRHYRDMYQRHGGDALDTGRAWDLMRRAEHAALAALSPAPEGERSIDECPICGRWMPAFGGEVFDGTTETCSGCPCPGPTPEKAREP